MKSTEFVPALERVTPPSSAEESESVGGDDGMRAEQEEEEDGVQIVEDSEPDDVWKIDVVFPSYHDAASIAVGLDHAEIWAKTLEFLPYHDVRSMAAVNKFFLQDVMTRITTVFIYSHKDLHVAQARRFEDGVVQSIYILSLFRKERFCPKLDVRPVRMATYCEQTAAKVAPFLAGFNQIPLKEVFFGAHLMGIRHGREIFHNMTWDGRSQWDDSYLNYKLPEQRFRTFRLGRKYLTFSVRALHHHRLLVKSVLAGLHGGALQKKLSSIGLVQGWICASHYNGKCSCWDVMNIIPEAWVRPKKSPWRRRLCPNARQIEEILRQRFFERAVVPNMTRQCVDGVKAVVLDSYFIELIQSTRERVTDKDKGTFPSHLVKFFNERLRRSPKVHSKLSVGDYVKLQLSGWEMDANDFVIVLVDTETHSVDIEAYCLQLESVLRHSPCGTDCEPFFEFKRTRMDLEGYHHFRLAWAPTRPLSSRRRVSALLRSVFGKDDDNTIKLERISSSEPSFAKLGLQSSDLFSTSSLGSLVQQPAGATATTKAFSVTSDDSPKPLEEALNEWQ